MSVSPNISEHHSVPAPPLNLDVSMPELTRALLDYESVSGNEQLIADAVHTALSFCPHLHLTRDGDAIIARTEFPPPPGAKGERTRIILAGHLDTVPLPTVEGSLGTVPSTVREEEDGYVLYGTMRFFVRTRGLAAHSGRAWRGENAIHALVPALAALASYDPKTIAVEGLDYREGLNAVQISGGVAGNVIPDAAAMHVNYRFAPDKNLDEAVAHVREVFAGYELDFVDLSPAARPGLDTPLAASLIEAVGQEPQPKYGWTDVARLSEIGIPAVNFGPGDALLAHTDNEHVSFSQLTRCHADLRAWLLSDRDED